MSSCRRDVVVDAFGIDVGGPCPDVLLAVSAGDPPEDLENRLPGPCRNLLRFLLKLLYRTAPSGPDGARATLDPPETPSGTDLDRDLETPVLSYVPSRFNDFVFRDVLYVYLSTANARMHIRAISMIRCCVDLHSLKFLVSLSLD